MATQTCRPFRRGTIRDLGFLQRGQRLASNGCNIVPTSLVNRINRIVDPRGPFWNWIWLVVRIISTSLDPLFFYIFMVNDHKKCVDLDKKLAIIAMSLRTFFDFFNMIYSSSTQHKNSRADARKYITLNSFRKDLLSCLPIPQVIKEDPNVAQCSYLLICSYVNMQFVHIKISEFNITFGL